MNASRWLLPFTHGVDMRAIDSVVRFAESAGATLVSVSLISAPHERGSQGARLEYIQQSKDFLEALQFKAVRLKVPVERYEVFTGNVLQSIALLVHDLRCDSILLVATGYQDVFLRASELKRLLEEPPASLVLMHLPASTQSAQTRRLSGRFLSWLPRLWRYKDDVKPVPDASGCEEPSWIRTEQHQPG